MRKLMTSVFLSSLLLALPAFYVPIHADQDDMENNADLQDTPEEKAKAAVLRRWPDATELDALDMAAEQDDADNANEGEAMDRKARDGDEEDAGEKDDPAPAMMGEEKEEDEDDGPNWTVSVLFVSGGKKFEALTDD